MKQPILFAAMGLAAFGAAAQEVGLVISSTPVIQQVAVPRTYCNQPTYVAPPQTSGGGGLLGALIGAGIGAGIGHGGGQAAAIVAGTTLGAIVGNNVEASNQQYVQSTPVCGSETTYENRTVGYNVTYEYAGRQYTVQMPYDPGPTIQLQVSPVTQSAPAAPVVAPPIQQSTMIVPAPIVYQTYQAYPAYPPAYPVYAPYPVYRPYVPLGVSLNFGYVRHRHRH